MILPNPRLLAEIRREKCAWCRRYVSGWMSAAHIFAKGLGAGHRQDTRANVVCLCVGCHNANHNGKEPTRADLLTVVASRCRCLAQDVEDVYRLYDRAPKNPTQEWFAKELKELTPGGQILFAQTWSEHLEGIAGHAEEEMSI